VGRKTHLKASKETKIRAKGTATKGRKRGGEEKGKKRYGQKDQGGATSLDGKGLAHKKGGKIEIILPRYRGDSDTRTTL